MPRKTFLDLNISSCCKSKMKYVEEDKFGHYVCTNCNKPCCVYNPSKGEIIPPILKEDKIDLNLYY